MEKGGERMQQLCGVIGAVSTVRDFWKKLEARDTRGKTMNGCLDRMKTGCRNIPESYQKNMTLKSVNRTKTMVGT